MRLSFSARKSLGDFRLDAAFESDAAVLGVFGPSGHGKSTVLRLLAGLLAPEDGEIVLDGLPLFSTSRKADLSAKERGIGCVFQDPLLFPHLDVRENLLYGLRRSKEDGVSLEEASEILELGPLLGRSALELSGGQARRVALGRALLRRPRLLLLDEPFSGLDEGLKDRIFPYLSAVLGRFRIPALYVSHSLEEILRLTRQVLVIKEGRTAACGDIFEAVDRGLVYGLIRGEGWINRLEGTAEGGTGGLGAVRVGGQSLRADTQGFAGKVSVRIAARDIILSRRPPEGLSARNRISGRLARTSAQGESVLCHIDIGTELVAEVTAEALRELGLSPGMDVYCVIKSNSIRVTTA